MRFQVPARVCETQIAARLSAEVRQIAGVQSVHLYRGQQKLSIRYRSELLDFHELALRLSGLLAELERLGLFADKAVIPVAGRRVWQHVRHNRMTRWVGEQYQAARETAQAARVLGKIGVSGPKALIKDPEKAVIDFLNDVLALYLIKAHWTRITQEWLVRPYVYRYEWLAVFYLFFLLVRSRRKK